MKKRIIMYQSLKERCDRTHSFYGQNHNYEPDSIYDDPYYNNIEGSLLFREFAMGDCLKDNPEICAYMFREMNVYKQNLDGKTTLKPSEPFSESISLLAKSSKTSTKKLISSFMNNPELLKIRKEYFSDYLTRLFEEYGNPSYQNLENLLGVSRNTFSGIINLKSDAQHSLCANLSLFFDFDVNQCRDLFAHAGMVLLKDVLPDSYLLFYIQNNYHGMRSFSTDLNDIYNDLNKARIRNGKKTESLSNGYSRLDKYNDGYIKDCYKDDGRLDFLWAWQHNPIFRNRLCKPE